MMLQNELNNESVRISPSVSGFSEEVIPTISTYNFARNSIPGSGIRGADGSGNEKRIQESGISTICLIAGENPQSQTKEEKPFNEKKKAKPCGTQMSKVSNKKVDFCEFSEPKLLTSLKIIESLHSLGEKSAQLKLQNQDLHISKKAARKVNIPFEEKIYKDLIDLHVTDADVGLTSLPLKPKEIVRAREPEPVLSDYYQPQYKKEYVIQPKPPIFEMAKFRMPQLSSVYQITKRWEPQDFS